MISDNYRAVLRETHAAHPKWGTSARKHASNVRQLIRSVRPTCVLDYGAGKGELSQSLKHEIQAHGIFFKEYDPGIPGKDERPAGQYDLVCCLDVMEHIEPDHLQEVMEHLKSLIQKVGFFVISNRYAKGILSDGRNAHLIVENPKWWFDVFKSHFENVTMGFDGVLSETYILVAADGLDVELEVITGRK